MQPYTGEIVADIRALAEDERKKFVPVPKWLEPDTKRALAGEEHATINLNEQTNLAKFAAKVRKKNRIRAKLAKKSRRVNRA